MNRLVVLTVLVCCGLVALSCWAAVPPVWLPLERIEVLDGDTIRADVVLPWGLVLAKQVIRANDYDAWEATARRRTVNATHEEQAKGKQAKAELIELAKTAKLYVVPDETHEPFGRRLGTILYEQANQPPESLAKWAEKHGHLRKPLE